MTADIDTAEVQVDCPTIVRNCVDCGAEFTTRGFTIGKKLIAFVHRCGGCAAKHDEALALARVEEDARKAEQLRAETAEAWNHICPPLYRETDPSRLPCSKSTVERVMNWTYGARGLLLHGPTGTGKTRLAYMLLRRLHFEKRNVEAYGSVRLGHRISEAFGEFRGEELMRDLGKVDVLMLDDLGKARLTERVEAEIFGLIEQRAAYGRPLIVTSNLTGATLAGKLSDDRADPLIRRLREFNECISFP